MVKYLYRSNLLLVETHADHSLQSYNYHAASAMLILVIQCIDSYNVCGVNKPSSVSILTKAHLPAK